MFLRIFVPLDGSPLAKRALDMAVGLANQTKMRDPALEPLLILFQALDRSAWPDLVEGVDERKRATETATRYLEEQAKRLRSQGLTIEIAVRLGNPAEVILEQAKASQIDLIVMSTHGRSGLAPWALGSVAERVARSVLVPMLMLPDTAAATILASEDQQTGMMPKILVPLDGSAKAEAALPAAAEIARLLGAGVHLLYVFLPNFEESSLEEGHRKWDAGRQRFHQVESYLKRQAETIQRAGIKANRTFEYGMPGAKINDTAHNQQVSLIVMTMQGSDGLMRWRLDSVAEEVLLYGRLPVLLVPSSKADPLSGPEAQGQRTITKEARL